jgi:hypothetical protein
MDLLLLLLLLHVYYVAFIQASFLLADTAFQS